MSWPIEVGKGDHRHLKGKETAYTLTMSLRELARRVDRDVKRVHGDAHALLNAGVLYKTDDGELEFPFSGVHVEFEIVASAA